MMAQVPRFLRQASQALACVGLLAALSVSRDAAAAPATDSYALDYTGRAQGLPNTIVTAALQTRDGYLWAATGGGLARFDGLHFVSFRPSNTPAFLTPLVIALFEDRDGTLWIGTARGVVRLKAGQFELIGLEDAAVDSFAQDRQGRVWMGTHDKGLYCWDGARLVHDTTYDAMPSQFITCLLIDAADRLWIGSGTAGVDCRDQGKYTHYLGSADLRDRLDSICEFPAGTLWLGTHGNGLVRLRAGAAERFGLNQGLAGPVVSCVRPASDGGLWVVSGVLQRLLDADHVSFASIAATPNRTMVWACEDREGGIWLCAREEGLSRARKVPYRLISRDSGLATSAVRTVAEDAAGNLWLALQHQGVARVAPSGQIRGFTAADGLPPDEPNFAYPAADGELWLGTNASLVRWNGSSSQRFPDLAQVRGVFRDSSTRMWFGTDDNGLFVYAEGRFRRVEASPGHPILHATSFSEAADHSLYVGSWAEGIYHLKDGQATLYELANGLPTNEVRAVFADREGRVWAGLRGRGLALLRNGLWWNPDALSEAVGDHVSALTDDAQGRLWMGTSAGVAWLWKREAEAAAAGAGAIPLIHLIGLGDNVGQLQAWSGAQPTVWKTHDGLLVFATRSGALVIDPDHLAINAVPPPVVVESVTADRRALPATAPIALPAGTRQLSFTYTALSFVQTDRVAFRYRLEGYDKDWNDAGSRRSATYTNLPKGRYVFRVSASNSDGVWNEAGASLDVVQEPYFYQTGPFLAAAIAAALALIYGLYRWSLRRLQLRLERLEEKQAMDRERQRIARHLHDDLGGDLTEIGLFAEAARRKQTLAEALQDVSSLSERVRGLLGSLDTIVWSVNPDNDSLDQLVVYICEYFQDRFRRLAIRCRLDLGEDPPPYRMTPEQRSNLFLAMKEAMNNVIKHAGATEVWLRMRMEGGVFKLSIEDNGAGFDPADPQATRRNGLRNIRSRVAELGGTVSLDSQPGAGTRLAIAIAFAADTPLRLAAEAAAGRP